MKIHDDISEVTGITQPVVTIGTYDGVHLAHQKIICRLNELAKEVNGESVLITFDPHPRLVLNPDDTIQMINTIEERKTLLDQYGIDHLVLIHFTLAFSELTAMDFVNEILLKGLKPYKLVIGYDHHFGKDREGSIDLLKSMADQLPFEIEEIPRQMIDDATISSTRIREDLLSGEIELANKYLGHPFSLTGSVVIGKQIGTRLGFPTANLAVADKHKIIPGNGIYAVKVKHQAFEHKGMLNIGLRPTLEGSQRTIEVHIFNFNQDIYQEKLELIFMKRVRSEIKFEDLEALSKQLQKDKEAVEAILK